MEVYLDAFLHALKVRTREYVGRILGVHERSRVSDRGGHLV
jgi:hypothetical protein